MNIQYTNKHQSYGQWYFYIVNFSILRIYEKTSYLVKLPS